MVTTNFLSINKSWGKQLQQGWEEESHVSCLAMDGWQDWAKQAGGDQTSFQGRTDAAAVVCVDIYKYIDVQSLAQFPKDGMIGCVWAYGYDSSKIPSKTPSW